MTGGNIGPAPLQIQEAVSWRSGFENGWLTVSRQAVAAYGLQPASDTNLVSPCTLDPAEPIPGQTTTHVSVVHPSEYNDTILDILGLDPTEFPAETGIMLANIKPQVISGVITFDVPGDGSPGAWTDYLMDEHRQGWSNGLGVRFQENGLPKALGYLVSLYGGTLALGAYPKTEIGSTADRAAVESYAEAITAGIYQAIN